MLTTPRNIDNQLITHAEMAAENVLVVYRAGDTVGQAMAEYYQTARAIPSANIIAHTETWTDASTTATEAQLDAIVDVLAPYYLVIDVKAIVLCGHFPTATNVSALVSFDSVIAGSYWFSLNPQHLYTQQENKPRQLVNYSDNNKASPLAGVNAYDVESFPTLSKITIPDDYLLDYTNISTDPTAIPVCRLDCSEMDGADTRITNPSRLNFVKRFIDDAIAAEAAEYSDVGTVLATTSGNSNQGVDLGAGLYTGLNTYFAADRIPNTGLYFDVLTYTEPHVIGRNRDISDPRDAAGLIMRTLTGNHMMQVVTSGTTGAVEPTWDTSKVGAITTDGTATLKFLLTLPASVYPDGADTVIAHRIGKTFEPIADVFFRVHGDESYYATTSEPEQIGDYTYRQGAITCFSMSYGANPATNKAADWQFGLIDGFNAQTESDCFEQTVGVTLDNSQGFQVTLCDISRDSTGGVIAAAVTTVANNVFLLEDTGSGLGLAALAICSGTLVNRLQQIIAAAPANWDITIPNSSIDSRCMVSLKNGACCSIGAAIEPYTNGAVKAPALLATMYNGSCFAEAIQNDWALEHFSGKIMNTHYGDPLYRPFGHL